MTNVMDDLKGVRVVRSYKSHLVGRASRFRINIGKTTSPYLSIPCWCGGTAGSRNALSPCWLWRRVE